MSLFMITGLPRSGKTYYAVWRTATTYFNQVSPGQFVLKPEFKDLKIISNIDNLKLPHDDLNKILSEVSGGSNRFFTYEYQQKVAEKHPKVLYLIDEPQFLFPFNLKDTKIFNWFQMHGHLGQDIFLITQDTKQISDHITRLAEQEINAIPKTNTLFFGKDLWYNYLSKGLITDKKCKFKRQWVFDLYKSQNSTSVEKTRNPFLKWIVLIFIFLIFGFYNARTLFFKETREKGTAIASTGQTAQDQEKTPSKPVPVSQNIDIRVSYLTENGIVYILFDGVFYKFKEFPYPIKNGPFKTLIASVPKDALTKTEDQKDLPASKKDRI